VKRRPAVSIGNVVHLDMPSSDHLKAHVDSVFGDDGDAAQEMLDALLAELLARGLPHDPRRAFTDFFIRLADYAPACTEAGFSVRGRPVFRFIGDRRDCWILEPFDGKAIMVGTSARVPETDEGDDEDPD
jgi:hypothetical protein